MMAILGAAMKLMRFCNASMKKHVLKEIMNTKRETVLLDTLVTCVLIVISVTPKALGLNALDVEITHRS